MKTGIYKQGDTTYYFDTATGKAITGFVTSEFGFTYYFDGKNGARKGYQIIDNKLYYFNTTGVMFTGFKRKNPNQAYYFDPVNGEAVTGFVPIIDLTYYFYGKDGTKSGLHTIEGDKYYLSSSGTLMSGLKE